MYVRNKITNSIYFAWSSYQTVKSCFLIPLFRGPHENVYIFLVLKKSSLPKEAFNNYVDKMGQLIVHCCPRDKG